LLPAFGGGAGDDAVDEAVVYGGGEGVHDEAAQ
jgi:hypothetical protein